MQKHPDIDLARLRSFIAQGKLFDVVYPERIPVALSVFSAPDRISFDEAMQGSYRPATVGEQFGPTWSTHWFKLGGRIPEAWAGREVHLRWDSSSEACVWKDGVPLQGLTGTGIPSEGQRPIRTEFVLMREARGGESLEVCIEMACNQMILTEGREEFTGKLRMAEFAVFDRLAWDLLWDFMVVAEMAMELPLTTPRGARALAAACEMLNRLDLEDPATWPVARDVAGSFLAARTGGDPQNLSAVGYGHLDTAWYWPLAETRRKCYRTFSTALRVMDAYDEYVFTASQAQHYEWIKTAQPALYAKLRRRVETGHFVPVGGTWVEPDCNIPSGESLVRQFLFGQRFFQQEFGLTCPEFWNPDVFGYNGQLPQIMRGAGIRYFVTQKLSWNQFNEPPSHTFWWEGIDGSRVLTHFPPADSYGGICTIKQLCHAVSNYKELDRSRESLYIFGYGDGGGGPTVDMLERLRRVPDVDGLPKVRIRSPRETLPRIEADARHLTTHIGEMYFENHRGTYTTQARTKRNNRRSEDLLHDVELLAAVAEAPYPTRELADAWKLVLLNQFHDILPGCSITQVYEDSARQYAEVFTTGDTLRRQALDALGLSTGLRLAAVNTLSQPRTEVVRLPESDTLAIVSAPAMGYRVQEPRRETEEPVSIRTDDERFVLENQYIRAVFLRDGTLVHLFDKRTQRETMAGEGNRFVLFGDEPMAYHAWNVEIFHMDKQFATGRAHTASVVEQNPLRASIAFDYDLTASSRLRQVVSLTAVSPRLDFTCDADWHESNKFLKVEFPTTIRSDHALYEIQFGHLSRPTHFNTSYDLARFEVCAHRWADLGEPGFGLALLNDCKYGHSTLGGTMRLSLLRSPKMPSTVADMGEHTFRYALLPHAGTPQEAGVAHEARRFNTPLILGRTHAAEGERSWFSVDHSSVVIDTVKKAESSDDLVVRLYEADGSHATTRLRCAFAVTAAHRCNLLEEPEAEVEWDDGITLEMGPFEIVTLSLSRLTEVDIVSSE